MTKQVEDLRQTLSKLDNEQLRERIRVLREERKPSVIAINNHVAKQKRKQQGQDKRVNSLVDQMTPEQREQLLKMLEE